MSLPQPILDQYLSLLAQIQVANNWLAALKTTVDYDGNNGTGLLFQAVANTEGILRSMARAKTTMETQFPELLTDTGAAPTA